MPSEKHRLPADPSRPTTTHSSPPDDDSPDPTSSASTRPSGGGSSSGARKKVVAAAPRTGQACDRCKNRKIRCDDTPGGCLPCRQVNGECKTTDRITHRATARGHTEVLERDVSLLRDQIVELERQLRDAGREPSSPADYAHGRPTMAYQWDTPSAGAFAWGSRIEDSTSSSASQGRKETRSRRTSAIGATSSGHLPRTRLGSHLGENYSGVSPAEDLSPVKGLALTLFSMTIDLGDCIPEDDEDSVTWWTTYDAVTGSMVGRKHAVNIAAQAKLPDTYEECVGYYGIWSTITHPCFPLLHKPDFENSIRKLYERETCTTAEEVCVHMMLAFMKYQAAVRNDHESDAFVEKFSEAMAHVHYCLSKYVELMRSRTVPDMVASVMICVVVRSFARPGAAWSLMQSTLSAGIEMGFHRSHTAWAKGDPERSILEIELRKRTFWTLFMCYVALCGKLGRPILLKRADYDIEFPEPLNDQLIRADPGDEPHHCTFYVAIEYFKMTEIFVDIYGTIYAVRPGPNSYEATIRELEWKMRKWKRELPPRLADTSSSENEHPTAARMFALWLKYWYSEMLLLVHHPGLCKSKSVDVVRHSLEVSDEAASQLIQTVIELWAHKSYDTTWYNMTTFLAAIFTRLFVVGERVDRITNEDLTKVERQNEECLNVLNDIGNLLGRGSGGRLRARMEKILNKGVNRIRRELAQRGKSTTVAGPDMRQSSLRSPAPSQESSTGSTRLATSITSPTRTHSQEQPSMVASPDNIFSTATDPQLPQHLRPRPFASPRSGVQSSARDMPYPSSRPGGYPSPRAGLYPSPRYGPYPSPVPPQAIPAYYHVYPSESHPYGVPHMIVHGQPPIHAEEFMLAPGEGHNYPEYSSQTAWRHFLETNSRPDGRDYMPASTLVALSGHGQPSQSSHGGLYGSSMTPQATQALDPDTIENSEIAPQEWPGVAYDRPGYSVLPDGSLQPKR